MMPRLFPALLLGAALTAHASAPLPPSSPSGAAAAPEAVEANRIYAAVRPSLLQIRTLLQSAERQSTIGSGFLVSADGFAITNYHVVSQYALEPKTYRLEYVAPDGSSGALTLLAIDVANDLAVVRLARHDLPYLRFDPRALNGELPKGERVYAMGNPLDLGFTIVEGTYNGLVERSYSDRIHFTGAINPGMSGGPAVDANDNVAKRWDGELVSFLVPARFAAALLERARSGAALDVANARNEIGHQLTARQSALYDTLLHDGFRAADSGPYRAPESAAPWFTCWANTNADRHPPPRGVIDTTSCRADTSLFIAEDLQVGGIQLSHAYVRSVDLNAFQFATFVSKYYNPLPQAGAWTGKRLTTPRCHEDFVAAPAKDDRPLLRAAWCARAYRDFPELYDVLVTAVTQDRDTQALTVQLSMQSVNYEAALALGQRFLETLAWSR